MTDEDSRICRGWEKWRNSTDDGKNDFKASMASCNAETRRQYVNYVLEEEDAGRMPTDVAGMFLELIREAENTNDRKPEWEK